MVEAVASINTGMGTDSTASIVYYTGSKLAVVVEANMALVIKGKLSPLINSSALYAATSSFRAVYMLLISQFDDSN